MRACGHDDDAIKGRAQVHVIAGLAERFAPSDLAVRADRDVHPQVQRGRAVCRPQTKLPQSGMQVVSAVVVILRAAQCCIVMHVAGRDDGVMAAR